MTQTLTQGKDLLTQLNAKLSSTAVFGSFPLSCLLIGLEALMDVEFSCPCRIEWNQALSNLVAIAPACFAFILIFLWLRPCACKVKSWNCLCDDATQDGVKRFLHCLFPPLVWFFLVLFDGSYYACSQTDWNGVYVHDLVLGNKWCKPTDVNESRELQLRNQTQTFINRSEHASYILLVVISAVTFVLVSIYDCRINLTCCGNEQPVSAATSQPQCSQTSATVQPQHGNSADMEMH